MGAGESIALEERGMPETYFAGVNYLMEGRYTHSELEFMRSFTRHPARAFWITLRSAVSAKHAESSASKQDTEASGDAPQREALVEDTVIELPVGKQLLVILDYLRLTANIIKSYLRKPKESICRIMAAMHSAQMIVNIQIFLYCFRAWRQEHEGDGRIESLVEGTPSINPLQPSVTGNEEGNGGERPCVDDIVVFSDRHSYSGRQSSNYPDGAEYSVNSKDEAKQRLNEDFKSKNYKSLWFDRGAKTREHVNFQDLQILCNSLQAYLRYYWSLAAFNYSVLCVNYVDVYFLSSNKELDANDKARVSKVYDNLMDIMRITMEEMQLGVALCEDEAIRTEFMKSIPKTDTSVKSCEDSDAPGSLNSSYNMFTHVPNDNCQEGNQTYMTTSGIFNPVHAVAISRSAKYPIKFAIHYENLLKSELAVVQPPGEREVFRYVRWVMLQDAFMVPGYNASLLRCILPEYQPSSSMCTTSFVLVNKDRGVDVVRPGRMQMEGEVVFERLTAIEDSADVKAKRKELEAAAKLTYYSNPQLDLGDVRIARFVNFEECYLVCMPNLIVYAQLFNRCGDKAKALEFRSYVLNGARIMYGGESEEYRFVKELCDIYII